MNTHLARIKSYKWNGDPVAAGIAFQNEDGISTDFSGKTLILKMNGESSKFIKIPKGLNVVAVPSPQTMGYTYYRMSDPQLKQYLEVANGGGQIVLG